MSLILVAGLWSIVITFVGIAVKAGLRSRRLSSLGAALAIGVTIAAFPLALGVSGAMTLSWPTLAIGVVVLLVPSTVVSYLIVRAFRP